MARVGLVDRQTLRDQLDGRAQVLDTRTRAEFTARMHATVPAAAICRGHGTCRTFITTDRIPTREFPTVIRRPQVTGRRSTGSPAGAARSVVSRSAGGHSRSGPPRRQNRWCRRTDLS